MRLSAIVAGCLFLGACSGFAQSPSGDAQGGKMTMPPPLFGGPGAGGMHGSMDNLGPVMMDIGELQELMAGIKIDKNVAAKIVAIARTFRHSLDENLLQIQKEEINIKEELLKDNPDQQAIQSSITRKSQVFAKIEFSQIKRDLDIKSLLTADEYERLKSAMKQKMRQMMPAMMGRLPPGDAVKDPQRSK
jgi:Spy/CpxP family protein refolding chaperone